MDFFIKRLAYRIMQKLFLELGSLYLEKHYIEYCLFIIYRFFFFCGEASFFLQQFTFLRLWQFLIQTLVFMGGIALIVCL